MFGVWEPHFQAYSLVAFCYVLEVSNVDGLKTPANLQALMYRTQRFVIFGFVL